MKVFIYWISIPIVFCLGVIIQSHEQLNVEDLDITAISAVFIAFMVFVLSVVEGLQNKTHNRLSVRPKLRWKGTVGDDRCSIYIELINSGLGPAKVIEFDVCIDGVVINRNGFDIESLNLNSKLIDEDNIRVVAFGKYTYLEAGYEDVVFCIPFKEKVESNILRDAIKHVSLKFTYSDIYGERIGRED